MLTADYDVEELGKLPITLRHSVPNPMSTEPKIGQTVLPVSLSVYSRGFHF